MARARCRSSSTLRSRPRRFDPDRSTCPAARSRSAEEPTRSSGTSFAGGDPEPDEEVGLEREERASIAVASNLPSSEWGQIITDPPPRRRHRRPRDLQRHHHRDRHQRLPATHPTSPNRWGQTTSARWGQNCLTFPACWTDLTQSGATISEKPTPIPWSTPRTSTAGRRRLPPPAATPVFRR